MLGVWMVLLMVDWLVQMTVMQSVDELEVMKVPLLAEVLAQQTVIVTADMRAVTWVLFLAEQMVVRQAYTLEVQSVDMKDIETVDSKAEQQENLKVGWMVQSKVVKQVDLTAADQEGVMVSDLVDMLAKCLEKWLESQQVGKLAAMRDCLQVNYSVDLKD